MGTDHQEIEWQYEAPGGFERVEEWLTGRGPGEFGLGVIRGPFEELIDTYYDTEDWRLYRACYALRVRREASGEGSEATMKSLVPATDNLHRRREISEPLEGDKVEALDAGADDYITKPINFAELEARVKSLLRIKALQDALSERERELSEMNEKLLKISLTDGLTGLDNRRHLEERLDEAFEHARRLAEPFSIVMCDLDKFKSVNDTYGHQAGDAVLKQLAEILKREAREIDRVGRYGGEEFMLLLPGTVLDSAVTFAERVRKEVEGHTFTFEGGSLRRTASFGVSAVPHPRIRDCEALVRAADDALYVAKETGRNRAIRFDSEEFNRHTSAEATAAGDNEASENPTTGATPADRPPQRSGDGRSAQRAPERAPERAGDSLGAPPG